MRRLSTSAIETIHEHNQSSLEPHRTVPTVARPHSFLPALRLAARLRAADGCCLLAECGQPRCHGPGASNRSNHVACLSASCRDRSRQKLHPNPIGSDTSLSQARGATSWRTVDTGRVSAPFDELARRTPLSRCSFPEVRGERTLRDRAASRVPPRRGARFAAPEVPSVIGHLFRGLPLSTGCPQSVDWEADAFSIFNPPRLPTRAFGAGRRLGRAPE